MEEKFKAKIKIIRVTYPRSGFQPGDFAIFRAECCDLDGDYFDRIMTFTGNVPSVSMNEEFNVIYEVVDNPKYGVQGKIISMNSIYSLDNKEDQKKFLEYVLTENTINALYNAFDDPVKLLEDENIEALCSVKGIKEKTALKLIAKYKESKDNSAAYVELYEYGMTKLMIDKLSEQFGSCDILIQRVHEDPYILIKYADGIGWSKADQIARSVGLGYNDPRRIRAYIQYYLREQAENEGHTRHSFEDIIEEVSIITDDLSSIDICKIIKDMINEEELYFCKETREIGSMEYRQIEENIAKELYRIQNAPLKTINYIEDAVRDCENETGFKYSDEQINVLNSLVKNNVVILTANAGSGKSSSMYPIVKAMEYNKMFVEQTCFSGKAAQNLSSITHITGKTIHRMLGYVMGKGFSFNEDHKLNADLIILDEASMVPEDIFLCMLKAIPDGCKLIMLGDTGQLEPIGIGAVLKDCCDSNMIKHCHLTKIYRQAQASGIITDSLKVYNQEQISQKSGVKEEIHGELQDMKLMYCSDAKEIQQKVIDQYLYYYEKENIPVEDIVMVTAKRVTGDLSSRTLNNIIQERINPSNGVEMKLKRKDGLNSYEISFRKNDRVLVTKNCYDAEDIEGNEVAVFNGNIGTVVEVFDSYIVVRLPQGDIRFDRITAESLDLGYAITTHKLQGSGIKHVIVECSTVDYIMLNKQWLYTALTRAKKSCTLVCQREAVKKAINTSKLDIKRTWLKELLENEFLKNI